MEQLIKWEQYWTSLKDGWGRAHYYCKACALHMYICCDDAQHGHKGNTCLEPIKCMFQQELES